MRQPAHPITEVIAYPLSQRLPEPTRTSWGTYDRVSILLVEVRTASGVVGWGEGLARFAPRAYSELVDTALAPRLAGREASDIAAHWQAMRRALSGRAGGVLVEAMAAVDIALWDILGKIAGQPLCRLLGGMGRAKVPVYAASVGWADDAAAQTQLARFLDAGFTRAKLKIGAPAAAACRRIALMRRLAGPDVELTVDANWAYGLDEAEMVARTLEEHGYAWFEEPLPPEDEDGYERLAARTAVPLAAGESNFTLAQAKRLVGNRTLAFLQPNITRSGGITEARRMADYAGAHDVKLAPHVGMSGIIAETAALHLAAAMPNTAVLECAASANRFKTELADLRPGAERAEGGHLAVPEGPGLGLTINRDALEALAA
ncbi:MAG: mandelate racemase/muconate lactonizing enzyme family protein [Acuticoccus sp.]